MRAAIRAFIERDVPILPARRESPIWGELEVGESFVVPRSPREDKFRAHRRIGWYAVRHGRKLGRKFITRLIEGGIRVWRIA